MIESIVGLESKNISGKRQVSVWLTGDDHETNTTIEFLICDKKYTQAVKLSPKEERKIPQDHNETGRCWVVVTDKETGEKTRKFLNLDAEESC